MEPDALPPIPNPAVGQPALNPLNADKPGKHSNRRSNHIVRRYRDSEAIIPTPTRVAKPVTLNTTPEQAHQAAVIASSAFQPLIPAPNLSDSGPLDGQNGQVGGVALDVEQSETKPKNRVGFVIAMILVGILLLVAAAGVGAYLATR
jgi:hypothetical protein